MAVGDVVYKVAAESTVRAAGVATDFFAGVVAKVSGNGDLTVDVRLQRSFSIALT